MAEYAIDRFNSRHGFARGAIAKPQSHPANDNVPQEFLVGLGNPLWAPPAIDIHSPAEVDGIARPLRIFRELVVQACETVGSADDGEIDECAVYIVSDVAGAVVKIGKAVNPIARLAQLQTGNPAELFVHRLFWMDRKDADMIEIEAHTQASARYQRLQGEWFKCTVNEAHEVVEDAIFDNRRPSKYCAMTPLTLLRGAA